MPLSLVFIPSEEAGTYEKEYKNNLSSERSFDACPQLEYDVEFIMP